MALSNDLISQFVKAVNDDKKAPTQTTVYGTTVDYNGTTYVKLDGSDLLTPVASTADTKAGERVTVMIKDHTATITGNMSSPAARKGDVDEIGDKISEVEILVADKVSTKQLEAEKARIDNLVTDNVKIREHLEASDATIDTIQSNYLVVNKKLTAHNGSIENLEAKKIDASVVEAKYATIDNLEATTAKVNALESTYGDFKDLTTYKLEAHDATIKNLQAKKLSATDADLRYANIDFTNIGKAAIENFYATSGIIKDLVIGDTSVTGKLVGVTITGDLIEGGTVKADKLVILGEDGLYYKLNVNSLGEATASSDPKYQNGLDGSVIIAKSITAEKVNVHDLVAFDATIGGFNITKNSIYSGSKESATNTTRGIYLDNDGQIAFGDGTSFIKYYKDPDGNYKLEISADNVSIKSSSGGTSMQDVIDSIKRAEASIEQNKEAISLRATKTEVNTIVDDTASDIRETISDANKETLDSCSNNIDKALENYVRTGDYTEYKKTVSTQLEILANQIEMNFSSVSEEITSVDGKTQSKFNELSKYIRYGIEGIEIGSTDSPLILTLDNDVISFTKNGEQIGWWDGVDFHTGNIVVDVQERAQFGNFAYVPRSDGSLMFLKVSG